MVRSGKVRVDRWRAKLSGDVRKQRYDSQKVFMVTQEAKATRDLVRIEEEIKIFADHEPITLLPYYIIFGKEIYSKQNKFKAQTLLNEVEILQAKWISRGLNWQILDCIKTLFVQAYKPGTYFTFDTSLLNGNDRLT